MQADRNEHLPTCWTELTGSFFWVRHSSIENWNAGFDENGRPKVVPGTDSSPEGSRVYPAGGGANNWRSPSYDPASGWMYLVFTESGQIYVRKPEEFEIGKEYWSGRGLPIPGDFAGTTVTLTNPGTLGTVQSVPRLMPGQGAIIGVGALAYPPGYEATDPRVIAELGIGKVVTLTSTYDHRIIQGAESGLFLAHVAECLTGEPRLLRRGLRVDGTCPTSRCGGSTTSTPTTPSDVEHQRLVKQVAGPEPHQHVPGPRPPDRPPRPARRPSRRQLHAELDPLSYGLTIWDLPRRFVADGLAGRDMATLDEILHLLRDAYCRTLGVEYMHIQDPEQKRWIQQHVEGVPTAVDGRRAAPHPRAAERGRGLRALPAHPLRRARSGSASRGPSRPSCCSTPCWTRRPRPASPRRSWAWPTGAG